jgi:Transcriptional regulator, AbiEi antitoxin/Protein of unknown function (DUF559)
VRPRPDRALLCAQLPGIVGAMDVDCRVGHAGADKLDNGPDQRIARAAAGEWGVLSLDELRACGLSREAVSRRVRKGWLHRLHRGVYAVGHPNPALEGRLLAAVKAGGASAALGHYSAAALWEFVDWDDRRPEIVVVGSGIRQLIGVRVHRTIRLDARDVARHRGIPVTSPARTLVDLASQLEYRALRRAVREAQSKRRVSTRQLAEAVERLRPRPGISKLARIVATGPAPTRSELEDVVLDLILLGGLARPDVNVPLTLSGRRVVPDFRWPGQRLVIEADGAAWHDHKLAREDDAERQALLEAHGNRVLRVTWEQALTRPQETLARLRAAGAPPADPLSSRSCRA